MIQILEKILRVSMNEESVHIVYNLWYEEQGPGLMTDNLIEQKMELIDVGSKKDLIRRHPYALDIELIAKRLAEELK